MGDNCGIIEKQTVKTKRNRVLSILNPNSVKKRRRGHHMISHATTLLDLNDDCLLTIFGNLKAIELCHVANVCKRFGPLAESAFRTTHKSDQFIRLRFDEGSCTKSELRRIICKFGHLVTYFFGTGRQLELNLLERSNNLRKLWLDEVIIDCKIAKPIFQRVEHLQLFDCKFVGNRSDISKDLFEAYNNLELLMYSSMEGVRPYGLERNYKLATLLFRNCVPSLSSFIQFLRFNKQLLCLGIPGDITDKYVSGIIKYGKQLTHIFLFVKEGIVSAETFERLGNLKNLRKLNIRSLYLCPSKSATTLIDGALRMNIPLSCLETHSFAIDSTALRSISKLETLVYLNLGGRIYCSKTEFMSLLVSLPLLNEIILTFAYPSPNNQDMSVIILITLIECGKQLNRIELIDVQKFRINEESYAKLLEVVKSSGRKERLSVIFIGCKFTTSYEVSNAIQRNNQMYLKIDYSISTSCCCKNCKSTLT
ncbi:uncharacterized protein LOC129575419 [Sitodiplosis mosellana]|uniref:uncharacterized protein LOC129575419 n=1 Tax=Sitodiplosis mosellana TaxID=263140 RepID=UPI0024446D98|nr:uncharacterized protein LOC129575419 [Sitodiplosis mosellana]